MKKAILLNSYVGDQLRIVVTGDYSRGVSSSEHKKSTQKRLATKEVKKKTSSK
jgi:hypothetical protein